MEEQEEVTLARLQRQRRALGNLDIRPNLIAQQQPASKRWNLKKPGSKGDARGTWRRDGGPGEPQAELGFHVPGSGLLWAWPPPPPPSPISPPQAPSCPASLPLSSAHLPRALRTLTEHRKQELSLHVEFRWKWQFEGGLEHSYEDSLLVSCWV